MKNKTSNRAIYVCIAIGLAQAALASNDLELIYSGPVESFNAPNGVYSVLGHQVSVSDRSTADVGSLVRVYGRLLPNGSVAGAVVERVSEYATGSDSVYLKGHVTAVDARIGRLSIDGTQIDYTNQLSDVAFELPSLGDTVEVLGTQPTARGVVLATSIRSIAQAAGVIQTGDKLGVIQTGNAAGVIQTGHSLGVIQTGKAAGVIQTGNAAGVIQTGHGLGVIQTGKAAGVIQTGHSLGVIQTGNGFGSLH